MICGARENVKGIVGGCMQGVARCSLWGRFIYRFVKVPLPTVAASARLCADASQGSPTRVPSLFWFLLKKKNLEIKKKVQERESARGKEAHRGTNGATGRAEG